MTAKTIYLLAFLFTATPVLAQIEGGNINGVVKDEQGGVLPGVSITVQGADRTQTFVTDENGQYRFLNLPPGAYTVTAALPGFTTIVQEQVAVAVGKNVELSMHMKVAAVAETITVSGASPVVDTRQTGTATNFTSAELTMIPTSRDPFALMRTVPGVLVDRVNVGGNETGQQSNFQSKGTRPQDAVWTLDGVVVTDMAAVGASPTYFNYDNFEEIQVSTAGQDIRQPTGGLGMNFVVKRGTNQVHATAHGYFDNHGLEATNLPTELASAGVTPETADHTDRIQDYYVDGGGPILKDRLWVYGSYGYQDVRLFRRALQAIDETTIKNPNVKLNWQATSKDMASFLFFNGMKVKDNRSPGVSGIIFDAPTATYHQDNAYTDSPLHGLWKLQDDRAFSSALFMSARYAFYNTGFVLAPEGGLDLQAGRDFTTGQSYGSVNESLNVRPQHTVNVDMNSFFSRWGSHDLKYGLGFRRADSTGNAIWPGNQMLALVNSATNLRARVYRNGGGTNRGDFVDLYAGDTISRGPVTIDVGLRYDRQWGAALASSVTGNSALPTLVPGIQFAGYRTPFTWNNLSPRAGLTYAFGEARHTVARASFSRYSGQLETGIIGFSNASTSAGYAEYPWADLNGNHFVDLNEVTVTATPLTVGGGFNPANPTSALSANVIDPNLQAPSTTSVVAGVDHQLRTNLAVQLNYTYTRTTNLIGNFTNYYTPWVNVGQGDYVPGAVLTGALLDGTTYSVPTFLPNPALVAASGNSRMITNNSGYWTDYHGMEVSVVKRLANRWMARAGFAFNNAREHYDPAGLRDWTGNPTPTDTEPLKDGGQFAPRSGGSGSGDVFINAKWSINANAMYELPGGFEAGGNVFGRQGYPLPPFVNASLGLDGTQRVLVAPAIDTIRLPNTWDVDLRLAKAFGPARSRVRVIGDLFNVLNANTPVVRQRNVAAANYNALAQNLSPRIFRLGVVVGF